MEEIITCVLSVVVGYAIGTIIILIVSAIWNRFKHYLTKKRVLRAIKALDIEDELANSVAGCNLRCTIAIEEYFVKHDWGMPFVGAFGNLYLCCMIGELRTEGKVKQLKPIIKGGE